MSKAPVKLTNNRLSPTFEVEASDQFGEIRKVRVSGESALTILVDDKELVTLMTLGTYPEELAVGYLYNQGLIDDLSGIESVTVDWERERADVKTRSGRGLSNLEEKTATRIVTSGCGQGTVFSCTLDKLYERRVPAFTAKQSTIYSLLRAISQYNQIYKAAGAVHGCALCRGDEILMFVEDVGRHNAADAIAGMMCLRNIEGGNKIFYTTGRLTSEIVMKSARMGIPMLLSRSGVTCMALELAADLNVTLIARAKGSAFLVYANPENVAYDAVPPKPQHRSA